MHGDSVVMELYIYVYSCLVSDYDAVLSSLGDCLETLHDQLSIGWVVKSPGAMGAVALLGNARSNGERERPEGVRQQAVRSREDHPVSQTQGGVRAVRKRRKAKKAVDRRRVCEGKQARGRNLEEVGRRAEGLSGHPEAFSGNGLGRRNG